MSVNVKNYMHGQIMEALNTLSEMADDITKVPNYRMMMLMRERLLKTSLPPVMAEEMVAKMTIKVTNAFLADTELVEALLSSYAKLINAYYVQLKKDTLYPDTMMLAMVNSMSIEFEV
jgi:hypothetical protein